MKIKSVRAFAIKSEMVGATYREGAAPTGKARRDPWTRTARVGSPMDGYERFSALRSSWRPAGPSVGCLVTADDGTTGFGVSRYGNPVIALINDHLAPLLAGEDAMATERVWDLMTRIASVYSSGGLAAYAISAVDLAMWDLKGKLLGMPVYALAGGPARQQQPCYATGNDTDWHMELGFRATKLACPAGVADGVRGLDANEELVARTRQFIGKDVELMLDCWMSFDVASAVQLAERLRPYGLSWIEDCLTPENLDAHDELRRRLPWQTLATGEHWYGVQPFLQAATRRLADIFQPDICWVGGFTACQRIDHIAAAAGIPLILHAGMNTPYGQHFSLASTNVPRGEFFMGSAPGVPLEDALVFPGMAVPRNGVLVVSDAPGFGLGLTPDVLEALAC